MGLGGELLVGGGGEGERGGDGFDPEFNGDAVSAPSEGYQVHRRHRDIYSQSGLQDPRLNQVWEEGGGGEGEGLG